jgi:leucyl/phenylalanyl-tRNA--protein transferase
VALIRFPPPEYASPEGIIAVVGSLTVENLLNAYRRGIFPWPMEGWPLTWFCPPERAILRFAELHVASSLAKVARRAPYQLTIDRDFRRVVAACAAAPRPDQDGTWITPAMIRAYGELHDAGHAHSVEVWDGEELVGGLYGVDAGGVFGGESMFHRRPNASKLALLHLIDHLRERGAEWLDIQVMTPHMQALGATPIDRADFLRLLAATQARGLRLFS